MTRRSAAALPGRVRVGGSRSGADCLGRPGPAGHSTRGSRIAHCRILTRRADRAGASSQTGRFRDTKKTLDNFEFSFGRQSGQLCIPDQLGSSAEIAQKDRENGPVRGTRSRAPDALAVQPLFHMTPRHHDRLGALENPRTRHDAHICEQTFPTAIPPGCLRSTGRPAS